MKSQIPKLFCKKYRLSLKITEAKIMQNTKNIVLILKGL